MIKGSFGGGGRGGGWMIYIDAKKQKYCKTKKDTSRTVHCGRN
jgi:hypothetical protein